jgi:hypothetical protein
MQFSDKQDFLFIERTSLPGGEIRTRDLGGSRPDGGAPAARIDDGRLCWHCCHACGPSGLRLPMPIDHDERTDVFTVVGAFCSFACMKAYNSGRKSSRKDVNYLNISLFARRFYGKCTRIPPALPRTNLAAFGGAMGIEEFRAAAVDPAYPEDPFSLRGEPAVVVVVDDSHNIPVVPHEGDPVMRVETRAPAPRQPPKGGAPQAKKPPAQKRKKKDAPNAAASADDAMLKLRRTDEGEEPRGQSGGQKCILESMLCFT